MRLDIYSQTQRERKYLSTHIITIIIKEMYENGKSLYFMKLYDILSIRIF